MSRTPNREPNKKNAWIGPVVVLLLTAPGLMVPIGIFAGIIWLVYKSVAKQQAAPTASSTRYTTRQKSFDACDQPVVCRHTDKSEHHVRRGKEIDPWDRPDIDISKYQRNR
jgi:hypothetical protein